MLVAVEDLAACVAREVHDLGPVGGVVLFDDLEAPAAVEHVAADDVFVE